MLTSSPVARDPAVAQFTVRQAGLCSCIVGRGWCGTDIVAGGGCLAAAFKTARALQAQEVAICLEGCCIAASVLEHVLCHIELAYPTLSHSNLTKASSSDFCQTHISYLFCLTRPL